MCWNRGGGTVSVVQPCSMGSRAGPVEKVRGGNSSPTSRSAVIGEHAIDVLPLPAMSSAEQARRAEKRAIPTALPPWGEAAPSRAKQHRVLRAWGNPCWYCVATSVNDVKPVQARHAQAVGLSTKGRTVSRVRPSARIRAEQVWPQARHAPRRSGCRARHNGASEFMLGLGGFCHDCAVWCSGFYSGCTQVPFTRAGGAWPHALSSHPAAADALLR
jgi:hypothetical protein